MFSEIGYCHFSATWFMYLCKQGAWTWLVAFLIFLSFYRAGQLAKLLSQEHTIFLGPCIRTGFLVEQTEHLTDWISFLALIRLLNFGLNLKKKPKKTTRKTLKRPNPHLELGEKSDFSSDWWKLQVITRQVPIWVGMLQSEGIKPLCQLPGLTALSSTSAYTFPRGSLLCPPLGTPTWELGSTNFHGAATSYLCSWAMGR